MSTIKQISVLQKDNTYITKDIGVDANNVDIDENNTLANKVENWDNKVDKVSGKGLSTNDYTTEDKTKLAGLTNYDDSALAGRVSELEGVIPGSASAENKLATMADIPSGSSGGSGVGTSDYLALDNKPQIAGITLSGNRTLADLGIQPSEEGKGLSTNDYTNEEKNKLAELNNYDDTSLSGRVTNIENIIPSTVSEENKLATIADISAGGGNESSNTFNTSDFDITEQGEVSLKPNQRAWIGTREEWNALSTEEKAKYGGIISITDDPNELDNKIDKVEGKGLSSNDFSNEDKAKLDGLSNYDDSALVGRVSDLENDLSNKVDKDGDKVLSTNDFTNTYKDKLDSLSNYDDTVLAGKVANIEGVVPDNANEDNKLVTVADLAEYNTNNNNNRFIGTHEEWEALTEEEQALYTDVIFTDDNGGNSGGSSTSSAQNINDFLKIIAPSFSELVNYSVGKLCIYQGELCKCIIEHPAGTWDDSHFGVTNLANEIYISGNEEIPNGDDLRY